MTDAQAEYWDERLNREYEQAKTDAEKMAVLEKYMGENEARRAFALIEHGWSGVRDVGAKSEDEGATHEGL